MKKGIEATGRRQSARLASKRKLNHQINPKQHQKMKETVKSGKKGKKEEQEVIEDKIKPEEDFHGWLNQNNLKIEEVLNKTVKIVKGTKPDYKEKVVQIQGVLMEVRLASKFLLSKREEIEEEMRNLVEGNKESDALYTQKYDALDVELEKTKDQLVESQKTLSLVEKSERQLRDYHATLLDNLNEKTRENRDLSADIVSAKENIHKLGIEVKNLKKNIKIIKKNMDEKVVGLDERRKYLEKSNQEETERHINLARKLEKKEEDIQQLEDSNRKYKEQIQRYEAETEKHNKQMQLIEDRNGILRQYHENEIENAEDLERKLAISLQEGAHIQSILTQKNALVSQLQIENSEIETNLKVQDEENEVIQNERRKLHNMIQELKGNIRVFCRVRPISETEENTEPNTKQKIITYPSQSQQGIITSDYDKEEKNITIMAQLSSMHPYQPYAFTFDKIFKQESTQEEIFKEISEIIQSALDGYKVCIFAYGQTGSGKTYTMLGDSKNEGVIPRTMEQIFNTSRNMETLGWKFALNAALIEIYNEEYHDLIGSEVSTTKKYTVTHDNEGNINISNMTWVNVNDRNSVEILLEKAKSKRAVGSTLMNIQSSRSHMVFMLRIEGVNTITEQKVKGVLNLIDLAGSERVKESGSSGERLKEAQNINKSLSSLGDVIMALSNKSSHVPYRNSKLTWLLKPCLGGDSKTLMFVNISESRQNSQESLCSLRFAAKVNTCEIGVARKTVKQHDIKE